MILKTIPQTEFEFPVVATKALIIKEYKDILKVNRDTYVLDLGCHINIFEYFPPIKYYRGELCEDYNGVSTPSSSKCI